MKRDGRWNGPIWRGGGSEVGHSDVSLTLPATKASVAKAGPNVGAMP
jgi:hypothetical protein